MFAPVRNKPKNAEYNIFVLFDDSQLKNEIIFAVFALSLHRR
jgi:hypothetical protein